MKNILFILYKLYSSANDTDYFYKINFIREIIYIKISLKVILII